MARKTNVVVKWGVAAKLPEGISLMVHDSREQARATYKSAGGVGMKVKRPFKIYVEV
jgi:hypothetical protein